MAETLEYRFARPDEVEPAARLVAHSFPGAERPIAWWVEQLRDPPYGGGAETLLLGFDGARMVAACQVHPLRQWIGGELFPMAGVGSVAVAPTHRRRNLGAELVARALREARARGDLCSALYPFRVSFYQKLGYGSAGEALEYRVEPEALPEDEGRARVELLDSAEGRREALELYGRWARAETGQLERSARLFEQVTSGQDRALFGYRGAAGGLEGYALATYRADAPFPERALEIDELVWITPEARRGLHGWLSTTGDQWRQVVLRVLPSHRLADRLREPRLPRGSVRGWALWAGAATLMMGPMFRLLDLAAAWERRRVLAAEPLTIALHVRDEQLAENDGELRLRLEGERVSVERGPGHTDVSLRMDVSTASRLFIGSLDTRAALGAGLLEADRPDLLGRLDGALRLPEPWLFDRF